MEENDLTKHLRIIPKIITSQPVQKIIKIYIFPNTSRSKVNQTMRFGQLKDYIMISIFLKKSCRNCGGEASPRPFY